MSASTNPLPSISPLEESGEGKLTREEWWALMTSLFGSAKDLYADGGGAEAFMRAERDWPEDDYR